MLCTTVKLTTRPSIAKSMDVGSRRYRDDRVHGDHTDDDTRDPSEWKLNWACKYSLI